MRPMHFLFIPFSVMEGFGDYRRLTSGLLEAKVAGTDILTVSGRAHTCEIIDASYDASPDYLPKTAVAHKRFWIDPKELVVLREQRSFDGLNWTADITTFSFNRPVSLETVKALRRMADQPKDRPYWIGRPLSNLTLQQLSGPPIRLADLRGRPVLLDFWGSYYSVQGGHSSRTGTRQAVPIFRTSRHHLNPGRCRNGKAELKRTAVGSTRALV